MRKLLLVLPVACTVLSAACSGAAGALPAGPATALKRALDDAGAVEPVVYICKQRYWSGKRYCYWRSGGYRWRWRWRFPRWWR